MVDRKQNLVDQVSGGALDFALVTRRTEPPAFAGEGQEVLVLAIIAPDPSEATFEGAAVDELFHDVFNHRAEWSVLGFVGVGVAVHEGGVVPLGALP
jgi:hypothetical protein